MIEHKQLNLHKPEQGLIGDCFRTSIACILNLRPSEVPHFVEQVYGTDESCIKLAQEWLLREHDINYAEFPLVCDDKAHLFKWVSSYFPGDMHLTLGCSSRNGNHSVVIRPDGYIWDPSIDNSGCIGPMGDGYWWLGILSKKL